MSQTEDKDFVLQAVQVWRSEDLTSYVLKDLDTRIKRDKAVKQSVFYTGLSAFTPDPINLFLKGESGVGKTFNTVESLKYFPPGCILFLGGMSRKSLVHSQGKLLNRHGEEIDVDSRPVKPSKKNFKDNEEGFNQAVERYQDEVKARREELRESYTVVDLSRKILVFLESPDYETFQMLRPILSHDKEEIEYQFVDKTSKGQLTTKKVKLKGWPACVFLSTDQKYMEELATRSFTATPENSEEKILEANTLINEKISLPWKYKKETEAFKVIKKLIERINEQTKESMLDVAVPFLNLYELFPKEISRDMRDFEHFCQFLKTITVLHLIQRPYLKLDKTKLLLSTLEDVKHAVDIYKEIFETTRTGTEQRILDFYHSIVKTKEGWYLKELTLKYNEKYHKKLSEASIRVMLERLDKIGYVNTEKDDIDKRKNFYMPLMKSEEKLKNPLETDSWIDLEAKLKKGFETWKTNIQKDSTFYIYKILSETNTWGEAEATLEELQTFILENKKIFSVDMKPSSFEIVSKEDSEPKMENTPEEAQKEKFKAILNKYKVDEDKLGIPCPYCKAKNVKMFCNSDSDLAAHVQAWHEEAP